MITTTPKKKNKREEVINKNAIFTHFFLTHHTLMMIDERTGIKENFLWLANHTLSYSIWQQQQQQTSKCTHLFIIVKWNSALETKIERHCHTVKWFNVNYFSKKKKNSAGLFFWLQKHQCNAQQFFLHSVQQTRVLRRENCLCEKLYSLCFFIFSLIQRIVLYSFSSTLSKSFYDKKRERKKKFKRKIATERWEKTTMWERKEKFILTKSWRKNCSAEK